MPRLDARRFMLGVLATFAVSFLVLAASETQAQRKQKGAPAPPVAKEAPHTRPEVKREQQPGFNGIEIVIFGAVDNSQQPSAESGYYDVLIVVEGVPGRVVVRRKNNVAGLWLNTSSATFDLVPSYYAIASTRPIDEITSEEFRASHGVGFQHLRFTPAFGQTQALTTEDLKEFRQAIVRLKEKQGLYIQGSYRVAFSGRSLFRSSIELPANVTVGPFETRVYLFHDEKLLSQYTVRLNLEREGLERHLHSFAFGYPTLYGLMTVTIAIAAGFLASTVFRKPT
jgi:uncharacterized protein (TIGR02186 family)